ncbi:MAG: hypothetical protein CME06_12705 [Gemmatimonadetes bacterium]|nr:hypothetical protein [Gemmatimonadota bacterium]
MRSLVFLAAPFFLLGCLSLTPSQSTPSLYLIDHPMTLLPEVPEGVEPLAYGVRVRDVEFPRVLDRNRIVYRHSANRLNYYRYHQWAVPPRTMVSDVLARHIAAAGIFEEVRRQFIDEQPDLEIRGRLFALERLDSGAFGAAHLAMELKLSRRTDGRVLAHHEFDRETRLHTESMTFFAQTISRMLEEETAVFLTQVWRAFDIEPVPSGEEALSPEESEVDDEGYRLVPLPLERRTHRGDDAS